ncbi:MAG: osmotically-inducible protein OsmY [Oceanospirillaceae bacterium]
MKALVEHIEVRFPSNWSKTDVQITIKVLAAFKDKYSIPEDKIDILVKDGWVTLSGEVPWNYQRVSAEDAVKHPLGVKGARNNITINQK